MAQQLQDFTLRMMTNVVEQHRNRPTHDHHCCALANEYAARLSMETPKTSIPTPAPSRPVSASSAQARKPFTQPMAKYINSLRKRVALELLSPRHRDLVLRVGKGEEILYSDASDLIETLKSHADQTVNTRYVEPSYIPEEGPYKVDEETFYLVVTSKDTGRRYAKKFNPNTRKFLYVGQAPFRLLTLDRRMSAIDAKVFGDLFSVCCNCGHRLTKKVSIDHGYGPICAERNGWPY